MTALGLGLGLGRSRRVAAAAPAEPVELWPQPTFDADTGLALVRCSVTGGQLVGNGSELPATCTATLAGGSIVDGDVFRYSVNVVAVDGDITLTIGGVAQVNVALGGAGVKTGTLTTTSPSTQTIVIRFGDNFGGDIVDDVSIKKEV